jgi:hypothetical protein
MRTRSFCTRTLEIQIVYPCRLAQGPGEQVSGARLLLGVVDSGALMRT